MTSLRFDCVVSLSHLLRQGQAAWRFPASRHLNKTQVLWVPACCGKHRVQILSEIKIPINSVGSEEIKIPINSVLISLRGVCLGVRCASCDWLDGSEAGAF